jgi:hypothetical protein
MNAYEQVLGVLGDLNFFPLDTSSATKTTTAPAAATTTITLSTTIIITVMATITTLK